MYNKGEKVRIKGIGEIIKLREEAPHLNFLGKGNAWFIGDSYEWVGEKQIEKIK